MKAISPNDGLPIRRRMNRRLLIVICTVLASLAIAALVIELTTATIALDNMVGKDGAVQLEPPYEIVTEEANGVLIKKYYGLQLSDELKEKAAMIARADLRVQALLAKGGRIGLIRPLLVGGQNTDGEDFSETWAEVEIENAGKTWIARVDLPRWRVDELVE